MTKPGSYRIVICTCPDLGTAESIAKALVEDRLAAGVNIVPGVRSVFAWDGAVRQAEECLLLAKTRAGRYPALETAIRARHPYELPQIVAVPIETGLAGYLDWIGSSTR